MFTAIVAGLAIAASARAVCPPTEDASARYQGALPIGGAFLGSGAAARAQRARSLIDELWRDVRVEPSAAQRSAAVDVADALLSEAAAVVAAASAASTRPAGLDEASRALRAPKFLERQLESLVLWYPPYLAKGFVAELRSGSMRARLRCESAANDARASCAVALLNGSDPVLAYEPEWREDLRQTIRIPCGSVSAFNDGSRAKLSSTNWGRLRGASAEPARTRTVVPSNVTASSVLEGGFDPTRAVDGDIRTAWVEGRRGPGRGEWIELRWPEPTSLESVTLFPGFGRSRNLFFANARARRVRLTFSDGHAVEVSFADVPALQPVILATESPPGAEPWSTPVTSVRIEILDVYPGSKYEDAAISEVIVTAAGGSSVERKADDEREAAPGSVSEAPRCPGGKEVRVPYGGVLPAIGIPGWTAWPAVRRTIDSAWSVPGAAPDSAVKAELARIASGLWSEAGAVLDTGARAHVCPVGCEEMSAVLRGIAAFAPSDLDQFVPSGSRDGEPGWIASFSRDRLSWRVACKQIEGYVCVAALVQNGHVAATYRATDYLGVSQEIAVSGGTVLLQSEPEAISGHASCLGQSAGEADYLAPVSGSIAVGAAASSAQPDRPASLAVDGRFGTAWMAGGSRAPGEWLELKWAPARRISRIAVLPGCTDSGNFRAHPRIRRAEVVRSDGRSVEVRFQDEAALQFADACSTELNTSASCEDPVTSIRLRIVEVYPGERDAWPCISEIEVYPSR